MIKSDVKKKIEASATITNPMLVVIVVSRRVGQVTLAVSERTSCRNLNGLKAIVDVIRVDVYWLRKSEQPSSAQPSSRRMSRQAGSIVRGKFKAAPDIRQSGPAAGAWYVLRGTPKVKIAGGASHPLDWGAGMGP